MEEYEASAGQILLFEDRTMTRTEALHTAVQGERRRNRGKKGGADCKGLRRKTPALLQGPSKESTGLVPERPLCAGDSHASGRWGVAALRAPGFTEMRDVRTSITQRVHCVGRDKAVGGSLLYQGGSSKECPRRRTPSIWTWKTINQPSSCPVFT